jgi:hypothetical protein
MNTWSYSPRALTGLTTALNKLLHASGAFSGNDEKDYMILSPQSLNNICSYSLFTQDDLIRLDELAQLQANSHSSANLHQDDSEERVLMLPPHIVSLYGQVFIEIVDILANPT